LSEEGLGFGEGRGRDEEGGGKCARRQEGRGGGGDDGKDSRGQERKGRRWGEVEEGKEEGGEGSRGGCGSGCTNEWMEGVSLKELDEIVWDDWQSKGDSRADRRLSM
jgi:hypothetical protein